MKDLGERLRSFTHNKVQSDCDVCTLVTTTPLSFSIQEANPAHHHNTPNTTKKQVIVLHYLEPPASKISARMHTIILILLTSCYRRCLTSASRSIFSSSHAERNKSDSCVLLSSFASRVSALTLLVSWLRRYSP